MLIVEPPGPLSVPRSGQVACCQATTTRAADIARVLVHFSLFQHQHLSTGLPVHLPTVPRTSVLVETPKDDNPRFEAQRAWRIRGLSLLTSSSCYFTEYIWVYSSFLQIILPHVRIPCARNSSPTSPSQPASAQLHLKSSSYSLPEGVLTPPSLLGPTFRIISSPLISPPLHTVCIPLLLTM